MRTTDTASDITGLGYCSIDYLSIVPRIPIDDKVEILRLMIQGGGPAATAVFAARRLGARAAFIGSTGDDEQGRQIRAEMAEAGVDVSAVRIRSGAASALAFCWIVESTGRRSIAWSRGTAAPLAADEVEPERIRSTRLLHLDGHHTQAAIRAADIARSAGIPVCLDAGSMLPGIEKLVESADLLIASEKFAAAFTGEKDHETAARRLFGRHTRFAGVTMGPAGSLGYDGRTLYRQPAFPVETVDTTGAGDVFHGAFAYRFVQGGEWNECLRYASAAAALKCRRSGGRSGIPTKSELERFLGDRPTAGGAR